MPSSRAPLASCPLTQIRKSLRTGLGEAKRHVQPSCGPRASQYRPRALSRVSGSRPPGIPSPLASLRSRPLGGGRRAAGGERPLEHRRPSPGSRRPSPPGSDRLSIQRPVARRPGSEAYPPGRSPGLDFATLPTPAAEPGEGGRPAQPGGRPGAGSPPAAAAAGGGAARGSPPARLRGPARRSPPPKLRIQVRAGSPPAEPATPPGPPRTPFGRRWSRAPSARGGDPQRTARHLPRRPRPWPQSPRGLGRPGLPPAPAPKMPHPLGRARGRVSHPTLPGGPSPLPARTRGAAGRAITLRSGEREFRTCQPFWVLFIEDILSPPPPARPPSPGRGFHLTPSLPTAGGG